MVGPATVCETESYTWFGQRVLLPGESFDAVEVPAADTGVQLMVAGIDVSPSGLAIMIGGLPAAIGNGLVGGALTATNITGESLVANSIALNIERCHQVAAASEPPPAATPASSTAVNVASQPNTLLIPETGVPSISLMLASASSAVVGAALLAVSRRRTTV